MDGLVQRWIAFNGVGGLGILVQLGVLTLLVRGLEAPYLWATAVAVECAVVHNFIWHQWWTWSDRPMRSLSGLGKRLLRFHALNGVVSLAGNVAIARLLTGEYHVDPLASNIIAIMVCSMVNFTASELLVFRRTVSVTVVMLLVGSAAFADTGNESVELRAATLQAWAAYERQVDGRLKASTVDGSLFFALDAFGVKGWRESATSGRIWMHRLERPLPAGGTVDVPDGKIHHWAGAVFVPGMTLQAVLQHLTSQAGRESEYYDDVIASRLIGRQGDSHRVFLKLRRTKVVTVTYNTEHAVEFTRLGTSRATARSVSTRIAELADAGTANEREKPDGSDQGFLWRLNAYWRYEAVSGGVLIECESISLSRDVPAVLKWFIGGMVEGVARDSLERTLTSLKRALVSTRTSQAASGFAHAGR
jgi:putative flippase GtrA